MAVEPNVEWDFREPTFREIAALKMRYGDDLYDKAAFLARHVNLRVAIVIREVAARERELARKRV